MAKGPYSDSERKPAATTCRLLFPITTARVTPVVEHWLEREIAQWVHVMRAHSLILCMIQRAYSNI